MVSYDSWGAFSLKSKLISSPLAVLAVKNPPPPKFPFAGEVTASANPVATIASKALPPFLRISIPTWEAILDVDDTAPFWLDIRFVQLVSSNKAHVIIVSVFLYIILSKVIKSPYKK